MLMFHLAFFFPNYSTIFLIQSWFFSTVCSILHYYVIKIIGYIGYKRRYSFLLLFCFFLAYLSFLGFHHTLHSLLFITNNCFHILIAESSSFQTTVFEGLTFTYPTPCHIVGVQQRFCLLNLFLIEG